MKTRVTELFDIELPFIGAGMVWMSTATLAAAVTNCGGLGIIAAGSFIPDTLAEEIDRARTLTDGPIGVNVPMLYPAAGELVDVAIEKKVKTVFTSAGSPKKFTSQIKEAGIRAVHVVPNAMLAAKCQAAGVDAVVAEGSEGGGHIAFDEVSTMVLTPAVKKAVDIPVIAAGGIGTGKQMAAAFILGAEGVQVGTRLIATAQCEGHINFKNAIIESTETGTVVTGKYIAPVRGIRNKLTQAVNEMEAQCSSKNEILEFIGGGRSMKASVQGDVEWGTVQAGQISGLINDIPNVEDLVRQMFDEAREELKKVGELFG